MSRNKSNSRHLAAQDSNILQPSDTSSVFRKQEMIMEAHMGPIPSAEEFKKYETILPGAADRILTMAEKQAAHRQKLEAAVVASNVDNSKRGQYFAFIISIAVIVVGFTLIIFDKGGWGLSMILGDLAVLVAVFIRNRASESRELSKKRRDNNPPDDK